TDLPTPTSPARRTRRPVPVADAGQVSTALRRAIAGQATVWIGYADPSGVAEDRQVEPLHLAGGYLTALDLTARVMATFAVARITGVQTP
ncbi:MAG: WYL domain-containing protein, partial [Candidatus Nanopelagicales bacterium]